MLAELLPAFPSGIGGAFSFSGAIVQRVAVFVDYENANRGGHGRFSGVGQPKHETVLDPLKLAKRIIDKRRDDSELVGVHVFRGRPLPMFQPEATSANDILAVAWERDGVHVPRRDLKYVTEDDGSWRAHIPPCR